MLRKSVLAVLLLLCCLVSVTLPKGLAAGSLATPSVTLPSGWILSDQTPYPNFGEVNHDPQGSGFLKYNNSLTLYDEVLIFYENSLGVSYSNAQLQAEAEIVYTRDLGNPFTNSGVTTYAGVPAGYVRVYNATDDFYELQLIMVMGNYYLDVFSRFAPSSEVSANSVINSISVPAPAPTSTPTPTPTATASPTPAPTPTSSPSQSVAPTQSSTPTQSSGPTPSSTAISTSTLSPSQTSSPSPGISSSPSTTPAQSSSPSPSSSSAQANLTGTVWVPSTGNGFVAPVFAAVALGAISAVILAITRTAVGSSNAQLGKKTKALIPGTIKKWLEDFAASKRKLAVDEKKGSPFLPTKPEVLAYGISIVILSLSFSYVKVSSLTQILSVLPTILVTSILVSFVKTFVLVSYVRSRGVWTEHKIWYFGLATFAVTTLAFRVPFSSPTRRAQYSPKSTKRLEGLLSLAEIGIALVFAAAFFVLLVGGFTLVGSTGLAMCLIGAFFDTFPLTPMNGKTLYEYKKKLWAIFFVITLALYAAWLLIM